MTDDDTRDTAAPNLLTALLFHKGDVASFGAAHDVNYFFFGKGETGLVRLGDRFYFVRALVDGGGNHVDEVDVLELVEFLVGEEDEDVT